MIEYRAIIATTSKYNPTYLRRVAERHERKAEVVSGALGFPRPAVPVYYLDALVGRLTAAWFHASYVAASFSIDDPAMIEKPVFPAVTLSATIGIVRVDLVLADLDDRGVTALQRMT